MIASRMTTPRWTLVSLALLCTFAAPVGAQKPFLDALKADCTLDSVEITLPEDGSTVYMRRDADTLALAIAAEVDCVDDTSNVTFSLASATAGVDFSDPLPHPLCRHRLAGTG